MADNSNSIKGRPATPDEVAYRDGYVQGRVAQDNAQRAAHARAQADSSAANGFLWGLLVVVIAVTAGGVFYYMGRGDIESPETPEVNVETPDAPDVTNINLEAPELPEINVETPELPEVNVDAPELPGNNAKSPEASDSEAATPAE